MTEAPAAYGNILPTSQPDTNTPLERVFAAAGCRTQAELAAFLGIRQSSISYAKKRDSIPAEWLLKLLRMKQINPEWILSGVEAKYLGVVNAAPSMPHVVKVVEVKPPAACSSQELFTELVRRAMQPLDSETVQREVAKTWQTISTLDIGKKNSR